MKPIFEENNPGLKKALETIDLLLATTPETVSTETRQRVLDALKTTNPDVHRGADFIAGARVPRP